MTARKRAKIDHEKIRRLLVAHNRDQKATLKAYRGRQGVRRPKEQSLKNAIKRMAERMAKEKKATPMPSRNWAQGLTPEEHRRRSKYDPRLNTPKAQHPLGGWIPASELKSEKPINLSDVRSLLLKYHNELPQTEKEISALKAALGALEARQKLLRERTATLEDWLNNPSTLEVCDWLDE